MVNTPDTTAPAAPSDAERRERTRAGAATTGILGGALTDTKLHPFGDLHTLQHLSARLARGVRATFEGLYRTETRAWAEPLEVQRAADHRATRGQRLTAWLPIAMDGRPMLAVLDGGHLLELLDLFFGGTGHAPQVLPAEFSGAAEALAARVGANLAEALAQAWEPVARTSFVAGRAEANPANLSGIEADEPVVVTRFGIARGDGKPLFVDLVYPIATLKPLATQLTGKVVAKPIEADAAWSTALARAAMGVRLPVRSVLAEPTISLNKLMNLAIGDIIPIAFTNDVPIKIGRTSLGTGTVGAANGHAAIRISKFEDIQA